MPYEMRFETPAEVQAQVDFADDPGTSRIDRDTRMVATGPALMPVAFL